MVARPSMSIAPPTSAVAGDDPSAFTIVWLRSTVLSLRTTEPSSSMPAATPTTKSAPELFTVARLPLTVERLMVAELKSPM